MQRLFTTFAGGWPGVGIFIQRFAVGIALLHDERMLSIAIPMTLHVIGTSLAVLIMLGLWTPLVGGLIVVIEVWMALASPGYAETAALIAVLSATLAMIGPGAFSIDALLFGRKHFGD